MAAGGFANSDCTRSWFTAHAGTKSLTQPGKPCDKPEAFNRPPRLFPLAIMTLLRFELHTQSRWHN